MNEVEKRIKNKYVQQGIRAVFVGFPDDSSGWLFYVHSAERTYISIDAIFDEIFTPPLCKPDLHFQGALRLRGTVLPVLKTDLFPLIWSRTYFFYNHFLLKKLYK